MNRATFALLYYEFLERTHDKWVIVISILFALLAGGVGLYGQADQEHSMDLIGPSLVTLTSMFVPLVALVLGHDAIVGERERNTLGLLLSLPFSRWDLILGKYLGRFLALFGAIVLGLGVTLPFLPSSGGISMILNLMGHTILLGAAFLSLGLLISTWVKRQTTAASLAVSFWFLLVFFYDMGLLGLLVITDGAIGSKWISRLILFNPAGLFRIQMMQPYTDENTFAQLGMTVGSTGSWIAIGIWSLWIIMPMIVSVIYLKKRKDV